jgi:1-acyl-sn-glycerol-3-phosphate acyltransferase
MLDRHRRFHEGIDFGIDYEFIERYGRAISYLLCAYFRPELHNPERIPLDSGAIVYSNHSGIGLWDVFSIVHAVNRYLKKAGRPGKVLRLLSHPNWFNWPIMDTWYSKMGYFPASIENASSLLRKKELVWWLPEAAYGAWKTCDKKYQLQEFSTGFVVSALQTRCPLIPAAVIGAEDAHNIVWSSTRFAKQGFPVVLTNPVPLPFQIHIHVGEPLVLPKEYRKKKLSKEQIRELAGFARGHLQKLIGRCRAQRELAFPRLSRWIESAYVGATTAFQAIEEAGTTLLRAVLGEDQSRGA